MQQYLCGVFLFHYDHPLILNSLKKPGSLREPARASEMAPLNPVENRFAPSFLLQ